MNQQLQVEQPSAAVVAAEAAAVTVVGHSFCMLKIFVVPLVLSRIPLVTSKLRSTANDRVHLPVTVVSFYKNNNVTRFLPTILRNIDHSCSATYLFIT